MFIIFFCCAFRRIGDCAVWCVIWCAVCCAAILTEVVHQNDVHHLAFSDGDKPMVRESFEECAHPSDAPLPSVGEEAHRDRPFTACPCDSFFVDDSRAGVFIVACRPDDVEPCLGITIHTFLLPYDGVEKAPWQYHISFFHNSKIYVGKNRNGIPQ